MLDPIGRFERIEWVASTGSTNADLVESVRSGQREPTVRFTDLQTAGRGRRDRTWDMEPGGGLLVSFFIPWTDRSTAHLVPTALGVAAVDAVAAHGRTVGLKWPNDLTVADGRKVAGMLSEVVADGSAMLGVVAGLGCNVSWRPPDAAGTNAAALDELGDQPVDRRALGFELCRGFDAALNRHSQMGVDALADEVRRRSHTIGQRVRVEQPSRTLEGTATDIDPDGRLVLDVDGRQHRIDVGDVVHLRAQQA